MSVDLGAQVIDVDITVLAARDDHDAHARHHRGRGVGAVRARRDQADVTSGVVPAEVILANREQAGELTLRTGVRLKAHAVVAGDRHQPLFEVGDQFANACAVAVRREGVQPGEFGPGDGLHLGGGIELHGARPEWNHAPVERDVLVRQGTKVTQHRRLGAVPVESRMRQELTRPSLDRLRETARRHTCHLEHLEDPIDVCGRGGLVARDRHRVGIHPAQVDSRAVGIGDDGVCATVHADLHRVEEGRVFDAESGGAQTVGERHGMCVYPTCDGAQAFWAVVCGIHRRHDSQQHLRGADVACRLLAADVLLTCLQRQPIGEVVVGVLGDTDETPGELTRKLGAHRQVACMRSTEAHRHAESLGGPEAHIGTLLSGRRDEGQCEEIGPDRDQSTGLVRGVDDRRDVEDSTRRSRRLEDDTEIVAVGQPTSRQPRIQRRLDDLDTERQCAGVDDSPGLWEEIGVDDEPSRLRLSGTPHERHGFGGGGGLVEHRRVRHLHGREVGDHRLEVQQRLEPALADLRLVRRVRGVPGRILDDVAQDDAGRDGVVVAETDHRPVDGVLRCQRRQTLERLLLGQRGVECRQPVVRRIVEDQ